MTRIIALTALTAPGLSDTPVHEPVHARGAHFASSRYRGQHHQERLTYIRATKLGGHGADGLYKPLSVASLLHLTRLSWVR
jgi:hypothetical protein